MSKIADDLNIANVKCTGIRMKVSDILSFIGEVFEDARKIGFERDRMLEFFEEEINLGLYNEVKAYLVNMRSFESAIKCLIGKCDSANEAVIFLDENLVRKLIVRKSLLQPRFWRIDAKRK